MWAGLLAGAAAAQTDVWVVDDDVNPAAQFQSIQDAIDFAADGDVILVKDGFYTAAITFRLWGRSLTIVGEAGEDVELFNAFSVRNMTVGDEVLIRGMECFRFDMRDNLGEIWIEDVVSVNAIPNNCASAAFVRCEFQANSSFSGVSCIGSGVTLLESGATGVPGVDGHIPAKFNEPVPGSRGTSGLEVVSGGSVFAAGCTFTGGDGGDGYDMNGECSDGGDGAGGVWQRFDSLLRLQDNLLQGGQPGTAVAPCDDGDRGPGVLLEAGASPAIPVSGPLRRFAASAPVREGEQIVLTADGEPDDTVVVFFSFGQRHLYSDALRGALLLDDPLLIGFVANVGPTGTLQLQATIPTLPAIHEAVVVYFTTGWISATGDECLGGSSSTVLLQAGIG